MPLGCSEMSVDNRQPVWWRGVSVVSSTPYDDLVAIEVLRIDLHAHLVTSIEFQRCWFSHATEFRSTEGQRRDGRSCHQLGLE